LVVMITRFKDSKSKGKTEGVEQSATGPITKQNKTNKVRKERKV
jgi:hypothetical protein